MKAAVRLPLLLFAVSFAESLIDRHGFVEEVSCGNAYLTIVLNKSDADVARWTRSETARPIAYVYGHKTRAPCGLALKAANGPPVFNFTIPYGRACNVFLTNLCIRKVIQEPNYQTAETRIAVEDNNDPSPSKPMRINHVFCLYTKRINTLRSNDVSSGHEVVASTGSKPKPKVEMLFRNQNGHAVKAVKFGDTVRLHLELSPDNAYKAISPKQCQFTDRPNLHDPQAKKLTFVQSNCPVKEISEIMEPLNSVNEEVYYAKFRTFRFGNQTTVYAHCTVKVCLKQAQCSQCYRHVVLGNLSESEARLIRRHRRDVTLPSGGGADHEVDVDVSTGGLVVLDGHQTEQEEVASSWAPSWAVSCARGSPSAARTLYVLLGTLAGLSLASWLLSLLLYRRLRQAKREELPPRPCSTLPQYHQQQPLAASSLASLVSDRTTLVGRRPAWVQTAEPQMHHRLPRL